MRTKNVLAAALAATAALVLGAATAAPATAAPAVRTQATSPDVATPAPDALVLTLTGANGQNVAQWERTVMLSCQPTTGGDHPDAAAACAGLAGVQGDFAALPVAHMACPDLFLPVTAAAQGFWNGQPLSYQQTFTNQCDLIRATGQIFNF
ncbi:subtilase-type protease inhibitor [Kitasatospora sp. NBC_01250]|uniref:SSI family serine proteinase inhibitor n=1 Tax=Kitasatospora sp. NBC_01250 TaxID=2903571 RepID=UPI002E36C515|nr:SSI family serine proteinase inhibitor [Kitasatospora sp. NBC_01250]